MYNCVTVAGLTEQFTNFKDGAVIHVFKAHNIAGLMEPIRLILGFVVIQPINPRIASRFLCVPHAHESRNGWLGQAETRCTRVLRECAITPWPGNLYDFYRLVSQKLFQGLKVPFRLEGTRRRHRLRVQQRRLRRHPRKIAGTSGAALTKKRRTVFSPPDSQSAHLRQESLFCVRCVHSAGNFYLWELQLPFPYIAFRLAVRNRRRSRSKCSR